MNHIRNDIPLELWILMCVCAVVLSANLKQTGLNNIFSSPVAGYGSPNSYATQNPQVSLDST